MTPNELMAVRFKVIADYPGMPPSLEIGFIIEEQQTLPYFMKFVVGKYPHLFKKLAWWEDRKEEDMPQYVKYCIDEKWVYCKIDKWEFGPFTTGYISRRSVITMHEDVLPATEQEYLSYEQSNTKQT